MQDHVAESHGGPHPFQDFWTSKAENRLAPGDVERVCRSIAISLADPSTSPRLVREAIGVLCEVATMEDARLRDFAQHVIFESIVERLSDSFEPAYVPLYDRIF